MSASGTGDITSFIGAITGTATITVTPKVGSCVGGAKNFNLNVNSPTIPAFSQLGPYCKDVKVAPLPTTSNNSISGTWSAEISTATVGTENYTFTPTNSVAPICATSALMTIQVNPNLTPTVSITSSDSDNLICPGTSVTFTPVPTNGGTNPSYQWKLNGGNVVGASDGTYTNNLLQDGDIVSVVMTSDLTCVATKTANSDTITIRTATNLAPTFTLSPICAGDKLFSLPLKSIEGVDGKWNPVLDVNMTKEYEFTPNTLGCFGKTKVTLKVNPLPVMTSTVGNYGLCNNTPTDIQFTSSTQNTTFSW